MSPALLPLLTVDAAYTVPAAQTARALFTGLPHGASYAHRLIDALATGALVAVAESVCAQALQPHLRDDETVVGVRVEVEHLAPAAVGSTLRLQGAAHAVEGRRVVFAIEVRDALECVGRASVVLSTVRRPLIDARVSGKAQRLAAA